ncbi:MAG: peptidase [Burkholderiaceae bacterium]|nr:peptidase [Burkholderiaceae bacterium]
MAGEAIEFTEADLAATASAYAPGTHEAPLVIGHPSTDDPAQGWVASLAANARGLFAVPRDVAPAFAEQVGQRRYGKVSAKFYRPDSPNNPVPGVWYLRHVGFLGAQPPGVKGLDDPAFSDGDDCVAFQEPVAFADAPAWPVAGALRRLRDWLLAKFGAEDADQALPGWYVEDVEAAARKDDLSQPAFAEPLRKATADAKGNPAQSPEESHEVTPEQKAALEAENAQLKQQIDALRAAQAKKAADARHEDNAAFAEQLVGEGRLAPKHKAALVAALDQVGAPGSDGKEVEFGECEDRQPLGKALRAMFADAPPVVEFGESATKERTATQSKTNPLLADAESRAAAQR